jgi:transcriptional regulator NrdR family protein
MEAKMMGRSMELTVVKADGATEQYIHTKVVATLANAFGSAGLSDIYAAEELARAVTFFLYQNDPPRAISSGEIFSIIQAVLAGAGFEDAAVALTEHHFQRKLRRGRVEVVAADGSSARGRWDKSRIVEDLVTADHLDRPTARTIASMVEEKALNMGVSLVSSALVKQLVLSDSAAIIHAQQQLQTV